ncbi:MAG TPA: hypothetical protein VHC22_18050 [Pirellulales bacterium]|nr:hypothetical protein [Pirellulales bacterium]
MTRRALTHNGRRARRIEHILTWCQDWDTAREGMIDLLTDARHWCDRHGESFAQLDRIAYQHYIAEFGSKE